jgi:hypothetical protein
VNPWLSGAVVAMTSLASIAVQIEHPKPTGRASERTWMHKAVDANLPEVVSRRARLVVTYCGQCHSPPPPGLHSSDEWRWMIVQMDMRAWTADRPSVRIAGNQALEDIASYYDDFSGD